MFKVKEKIKPSGKGRTAAEWGEIYGTIIEVKETTAIVRWGNSAVEDEMQFDELISTGEFAKEISRNCRALGRNDDNSTVDKLLTVEED